MHLRLLDAIPRHAKDEINQRVYCLSGGNSLATTRFLYACPYRATFVFLRPQGSDPI
jgi:hypothetical protein